MFILKWLRFPCPIVSGGDGGGERQWDIDRHPWRVTSRYFTYIILNTYGLNIYSVHN